VPAGEDKEDAMSREQLLATAFVELANTLDDEFDVLDFLQNLVTRSSDIFSSATATLMLADQRGALQMIASTSHDAELLELVAIPEGPHISAFESGLAQVNFDAEARGRWPRFAGSAESLGYLAVHVVPMRVRTEVLGSLTLLHAGQATLDDDDVAILEALASVATIGLLQERTPSQKERLAEQLQTALNLRIVIEQAKGILAELAGVRPGEAFDLLNAYARRGNLRLSAVATAVVEARLGLAALRDQRT
jgi:transcriptional regulator with GAF, ATPase, and Fis domain